ncbi:MAG TPA: cadherin-like domain-containing protein, partial [Terriglobia bacterium]|nr:cadherin-like domain-containing protein [Terriglobia bacterium]
PVANNDSYTVNQNGTLIIAAPGVLANDTDVDGNTLTAALVAGPASGSLTLNGNGSFTYTPNANFNGTDSFSYRATDGTANSNTATVTITVNGSNTAPVANDDCYTMNEDGVLNITAPGVLANDTDVNGDALTAVLVSGASHGTLTLNGNDSFVYTPNANFNGNDTFTYRANDGTANSNLATVTIVVCPINDAPVANNDSYITNQDTPLTVTIPGVLANDTDADGNAITAVLNSGPSHGALTLNANGSFTYTATAGFTGSDSFTYRASDGSTTSAIATVAITVNAVANAPLVTSPASITIAATSAGGAMATTSQLLAAYLASGSAVDPTDPAPVRLTPQINGVDVSPSTPFALGTTAVTFRYRNTAGQIGTATSYVNVIVGTVSISNSITGKGVDASGNYYVDLKLTNTGTGNAFNLAITEASFRTLTGTGSVSLLNPGAMTVGYLEAGASATIRILLSRPVTVKRFSFTQMMTFNDVTGVNFSASASQTVIP